MDAGDEAGDACQAVMAAHLARQGCSKTRDEATGGADGDNRRAQDQAVEGSAEHGS